MRILAIDPGNVESAYALIDTDTYRPLHFAKKLNAAVLDAIQFWPGIEAHHVVIEQIGHYGTGMPAGRTVFDTCVWIGRFYETAWRDFGHEPELVLRPTVKAHLCGSAKAKDPNVIQALIDRFAPDVRNKGKGTKAEPGFFHGFRADVWQAYALAVYAADQHNHRAAPAPF